MPRLDKLDKRTWVVLLRDKIIGEHTDEASARVHMRSQPYCGPKGQTPYRVARVRVVECDGEEGS